MSSPTDKLVVPEVKEPQSLIDDVLHLPDYLTASKWFATIMESNFGVDPFKEAGKALGGNWPAMQQAGGALINIAEYHREYATHMRQQISVLTEVSATPMGNGPTSGSDGVNALWVGNAATAANGYFRIFSERLNAQASVMQTVGEGILQVVTKVYDAAHLLENLLQDAFDAIYQFALTAAVTAIFPPAGVVVGGASLFDRAQKAIRRVIECLTKIKTFVDLAKGVLGGILANNGVDAMKLPELTKGGYDHPGVFGDA
ncbi:hypothetical protein [Mycobacteroides salmoniphilum]|uniref:ESX-1 secretion-associated protein EspA n=1 Tax=Mycobacteroides salmoniphilum TaxID=404941 RepID=A0A4R8SHY2_9MYCO|nr:hypothetical protein [Mycobacteroides salmoniphilum]TDZ96598.1 hypothetical protein CCUG60885_02742 [Mycobacteroides salmoniphilum]TEA05693.1 hypothetical protein CCUG60883_02999 [Mycobacteroides salmoniphilum]